MLINALYLAGEAWRRVRDDAVRDAVARARSVLGGGDPVRGVNQGRAQCSPREQGEKMARVRAVCGVPAVLPLLFVAMAMAASDLFDNQLGDISYCKNQCQITIKNKKAAKVSDLQKLNTFSRDNMHDLGMSCPRVGPIAAISKY